MTVIRKIKSSKFNLLLTVLPVVLVAGIMKLTFHYLGWEIIPSHLSAFFPSILTGIIFILGFLLAGVIADYKESEKIPNEIAASLYALWQEAEFTYKTNKSEAAMHLMQKLKTFVPIFKSDFMIKNNDKLKQLTDSFSDDIIEMSKEGAIANYLVRMKAEQANLKKLINRILVIKNTDFIPSVFLAIKFISGIFLIIYSMLQIEPWWGGLILIGIFSFVIFTIIFLIKDMEDPFEYKEGNEAKSDEVSLEVLDNLHWEFNKA